MTKPAHKIHIGVVPMSRDTRTSKRVLRIDIKPDEKKSRVPAGHPLCFWSIDEAAKQTGVSDELLRSSDCPRANLGRRVVFDPIETVAWVRLHLTHTVATERGE